MLVASSPLRAWREMKSSCFVVQPAGFWLDVEGAMIVSADAEVRCFDLRIRTWSAISDIVE